MYTTATGEMASAVSAEAVRRVAEAGEAATKRFTDARDMLDSFVKNQPVLALGAALAAGVLIGWLIKRR
jgi:ElaB/YqjD/DUF883 family membrane-anchored ribosome-binding protein